MQNKDEKNYQKNLDEQKVEKNDPNKCDIFGSGNRECSLGWLKNVREKAVMATLWLLRSESKNEDTRRREFIFNVVILCLIGVSFLVNVAVLFNEFLMKSDYYARGVSFGTSFAIFAIFLFLYFLSRSGFYFISVYFLVGVYFFITTFTAYRWGIDVPQFLLSYALIIVISGILVSSRLSFFIAILTVVTMFSIFWLHSNGIIVPEILWKSDQPRLSDIFVYGSTFIFISVISWLSNREIEKSLKRAKKSEAELKSERDLLEIRVEQRTRELQEMQMEKMVQLHNFAELGRISSGLFHDLINYLTALSLNLNEARSLYGKEIGNMKEYLDCAYDVSENMENFVGAVKDQLCQQEIKRAFLLAKEIDNVLQVLRYKAKKYQVDLVFEGENMLVTFGNNFKFNRIMTNVISNAIDSYANIQKNESDRREVCIKLKLSGNETHISVRDWGAGIADSVKEKIFQPFFTTKGQQHGMGIGLSMTRDMIELDFGGRIHMESEEGKGTTFFIIFPLKKENE